MREFSVGGPNPALSSNLIYRIRSETEIETMRTVKAKPNPNPKPILELMEVCCEACHLIQRYRGKSHVTCVHCGSPMGPTKFEIPEKESRELHLTADLAKGCH